MKTSAKIGIGMGVVVILLFSAIVLAWMMDTKYATLARDLPPQEAGQIVSELQTMKVAYRLSEGGTRILVPAQQVQETRVQLQSSGKPLSGGGIGFEVFDKSGFGMSDFAQKINYQRALQGELARTIMALDEVKYARVHLVLPEKTLFQQSKDSASAAVTLVLKENRWLQPHQIKGLQQLVAASVPGLAPDAVTLVDQDGATLNTITSELDPQERAASERLRRKQEVEMYLMRKAQTMLQKAFGEGNAMVSVDVELNLSEKKTTQENVVPNPPNAGVLRKRETKHLADEKKGGQSEVTEEIEYQFGRKVEEVVQTPGEIERISVGVLVPSHTPGRRIDQIKELIAVSVGLNTERGDMISVQAVDYEIDTHKHVLASANTDDAAHAVSPALTASDAVGNTSMHQINNQNSTAANMLDNPRETGELEAESTSFSIFLNSMLADVWETLRHVGRMVASWPLWLSVGMPLFLLIGWIVNGIVRRARRQHAARRRLSEDEKERVLVQMKDWLEKGDRPRPLAESMRARS